MSQKASDQARKAALPIRSVAIPSYRDREYSEVQRSDMVEEEWI